MTDLRTTAFVGVYGSLQLHAPLAPDKLTEDAYSLFHARATALGWLSDAGDAASTPTAVWGMNDAGQDWSGAPGTARVAWFQVVLLGPAGTAAAVPVEGLVACAADTLDRVGVLRLDGLQLVLPVRTGAGARHLAAAGSWFAVGTGRPTAAVTTTLDCGSGPVDPERADAVAGWLAALGGDLWVAEGHTADANAAVHLVPPVAEGLWPDDGPPLVTLHGTLPEWSLDALGWAAAVTVEACHRADVPGTVRISTTRRYPQSSANIGHA
jgi:hypothetical protein